MTADAASAPAQRQHGMLPAATHRPRQHGFSPAVRGPSVRYQQDPTPMGSALRSCTALWHAVINSQHQGLVLLCAEPIRLLPGCETAPACLHDCQGYMRRLRTRMSCRQGMRLLWPTLPSEWGTEAG